MRQEIRQEEIGPSPKKKPRATVSFFVLGAFWKFFELYHLQYHGETILGSIETPAKRRKSELVNISQVLVNLMFILFDAFCSLEANLAFPITIPFKAAAKVVQTRRKRRSDAK